ncbi:MAG: hybrid sensor histidine kinase/response regulator [Boseongicola sp.]|nr:hybrid sensor histidine kinase/response regulator [Boseongicola sp.]
MLSNTHPEPLEVAKSDDKAVLDVLILDDLEADRMRVRRLCRKAGLDFELHEAHDLASFRERINSTKMDLVFLDYHLAMDTGLDALQLLQAQEDQVNAIPIMITSIDRYDIAVEAMRAGCADYLTKEELSVDSIRKSIISAFERRILISALKSPTPRSTRYAFQWHVSRRHAGPRFAVSLRRPCDMFAPCGPRIPSAQTSTPASMAWKNHADKSIPFSKKCPACLRWKKPLEQVLTSPLRWQNPDAIHPVSSKSRTSILSEVTKMHGLSVLIVDDDHGDRNLLRRILGDSDLEPNIVEVETAEAALGFEDHAFDAIFLDYHLPMIEGLSALSACREAWPRAAVFLMTGQGDEDVAKSAILEGASDYLSKSSIHASLLIGTLRKGVMAARMRTRLEEQYDDLATFAEVLVHDFRAPIRAAAYLTEQIVEDLNAGDTDEVRHGLAVLRASAVQMSDMVRSLSDHIRFDRDDAFETAQPDLLLKRVLRTLDLELSQSQAKVETSASIDLPAVRCQPPQIAQTLQNLIENALKYAGDSTPQISLTIREDDCGMVVFEVADRGIGIPEKFLERVFEPFKRVPGTGDTQGTGLGLATCKKVVQRHGGRIWCASELGRGTIMRFTLPKADVSNQSANWENAGSFASQAPKGLQLQG